MDTDCSNEDYGGVHMNSGVPAHVYATMVDGGVVSVPDGPNVLGYDDDYTLRPNDDTADNNPTYTYAP